jgi:hypothetical protein
VNGLLVPPQKHVKHPTNAETRRRSGALPPQ